MTKHYFLYYMCKNCYAWNKELVFQMMGNSQHGALQCFIYCLLSLIRFRTDAPGLRRYIYSPIVYGEWELRTSLLWYKRRVYALLITNFISEILFGSEKRDCYFRIQIDEFYLFLR